jgi:hypothetical protein
MVACSTCSPKKTETSLRIRRTGIASPHSLRLSSVTERQRYSRLSEGDSMASSDHYSQELSAQLRRAATRGMSHILVNARELHSSPGEFPIANDKMVSCRLAMRSEMTADDALLVSEDNAAGMTVRYVLPRTAK